MSAALLLTGALVLLVSGVGHLRGPRATSALIGAHGVLPARYAASLTVILVVVEIALGAALVLAVTLGSTGAQRALGLGAVAVFAVLAGYAHTAWRARPHDAQLCACGVAESPLGPAVTGRAVLLALVSAGGALSVGGTSLLGRPWDELVVLACAVTSLTVLLILLPAARAVGPRVPVGGAWS